MKLISIICFLALGFFGIYSRSKINSIHVKGIPLLATTRVAIDEKAINKSFFVEYFLNDKFTLERIDTKLKDLNLLKNQDQVTDIRLKCSLKRSFLQKDIIYILRGGVIKWQNSFYEEDYELTVMLVSAVPAKFKKSFTPMSPIID
ncbi:MAG: hypothetical protein AAFN93_19830 [Bacteroidota bacterium]